MEPAIIEEKAKADKKFVMISYNWGEKELVMALKNELVRHGINVSFFTLYMYKYENIPIE